MVFFESSFSEFLGLGFTPGASLLTRNIFHGGESLSVTFQGTIGTVASEAAGTSNEIFNAYELSLQTKLSFPRFFLLMGGEEFIPKSWNPKSDIALGVNLQRNIGLGRISYNAGLNYNIKPSKSITHAFNIFNTNLVNNLESDRYFDVFSSDRSIFNSTVEAVNQFDLSLGIESIFNGNFSNEVTNGGISEDNAIRLISDYFTNDLDFPSSLPISDFSVEDYAQFASMIKRRERLVQDYYVNSFIHDFTFNQSKIDKIKHPWFISTKLELAGLYLRFFDQIIGLPELELDRLIVKDGETLVEPETVKGLFNLPYSEYLKVNLDVRKQFFFNRNTSLVFRNFFGVVLPYGNSKNLSIPFDRAYFAGGANDVRAWRAFSLGPTPQSVLGNFAVENMKITWNLEYRFNLIGQMNSAFFVDVGNIWSIEKDDFSDTNQSELFTFDGFHQQLAVGGGIGFRYDFEYLILRFDLAYKFRDPTIPGGTQWVFDEFNILNPTLNFGINYPF